MKILNYIIEQFFEKSIVYYFKCASSYHMRRIPPVRTVVQREKQKQCGRGKRSSQGPSAPGGEKPARAAGNCSGGEKLQWWYHEVLLRGPKAPGVGIAARAVKNPSVAVFLEPPRRLKRSGGPERKAGAVCRAVQGAPLFPFALFSAFSLGYFCPTCRFRFFPTLFAPADTAGGRGGRGGCESSRNLTSLFFALLSFFPPIAYVYLFRPLTWPPWAMLGAPMILRRRGRIIIKIFT
jgi:hypothetical protein